MSDFLVSQIRTHVPVLVGTLISFLTTLGLDLDVETQAGLIAGLTGVIISLYYLIVRLIEKKFPKVGILLGSTKTPNYDK